MRGGRSLRLLLSLHGGAVSGEFRGRSEAAAVRFAGNCLIRRPDEESSHRADIHPDVPGADSRRMLLLLLIIIINYYYYYFVCHSCSLLLAPENEIQGGWLYLGP